MRGVEQAGPAEEEVDQGGGDGGEGQCRGGVGALLACQVGEGEDAQEEECQVAVGAHCGGEYSLPPFPSVTVALWGFFSAVFSIFLHSAREMKSRITCTFDHYCTMTNDRHVYVRVWRTVAQQLFAPDGACAMMFYFNMCMKR